MAVNALEKTLRPRLTESGEYVLTIGWVSETENLDGVSVRFDTGDCSTFFYTFVLTDDDRPQDKLWFGQMVRAARIGSPAYPEDLLGARFRAGVKVDTHGDKRYYNFKYMEVLNAE